MALESKLQVDRSGNLGEGGSICLRARIFYPLHLVQTVCGPLIASYPVLMDDFSSGKSSRVLKPIRHLHVVEVNTWWRSTSARPYFFMVCCIVTLKEYFIFIMGNMDHRLCVFGYDGYLTKVSKWGCAFSL
jgi:hypothetical protein